MRPMQRKQQVTPSGAPCGFTSAGRECRNARLTQDEAAALVCAAGGGDRRAWERLVDAYVGLVWATARGHRLGDGDAHDVAQTTWLRLVENLDRLTDPGRVGVWLATTARRECLCLLRRSGRSVLLECGEDIDTADRGAADVGGAALPLQVPQAVLETLDQLDPSAEALLRLLMLDPPPSDDEISAALGIPTRSIGPTRGRCLAKLEELMGQRGIP